MRTCLLVCGNMSSLTWVFPAMWTSPDVSSVERHGNRVHFTHKNIEATLPCDGERETGSGPRLASTTLPEPLVAFSGGSLKSPNIYTTKIGRHCESGGCALGLAFSRFFLKRQSVVKHWPAQLCPAPG